MAVDAKEKTDQSDIMKLVKKHAAVVLAILLGGSGVGAQLSGVNQQVGTEEIVKVAVDAIHRYEADRHTESKLDFITRVGRDKEKCVLDDIESGSTRYDSEVLCTLRSIHEVGIRSIR